MDRYSSSSLLGRQWSIGVELLHTAGIAVAALALALAGAAPAKAVTWTVAIPPELNCVIDTNPYPPMVCGAQPFALTAGTDWWYPDSEYRTLASYDLEAYIPPGSEIASAEIRASHSWSEQPSRNTTVYVHQVTRTWNASATWESPDGTSSWASPGGDYGPALDSAWACCNEPDTSTWDVTATVVHWADGTVPNHGVIFESPDIDAFHKAEHGVPVLDVVYERPADTTPPHLSIQGTLYEDRMFVFPPGTYDLALAANDDATGTSGMEHVTVAIDGVEQLSATADAGCVGAYCDVDSDHFVLNATSLQGSHLLEVQARDRAGNVTRAAWTATFGGTPTPWESGAAGTADARTLAPVHGDGLGCPAVTRAVLPRLDEAPEQILHGTWAAANGGAGRETTELLADGAYRVTRCTDAGALVVSQLVAPVPVPGGVANLEVSRTEPSGDRYGTTHIDYLSPDDPVFIAEWKRYGDVARARVLAPTTFASKGG